jgi:glutamate N-acetyltransferase/amino-acid N-acetyltransferase
MAPAETPFRGPIPPLPKGFLVSGLHSGLKRNPTREDISLIVSDRPATAAGVYTQNLVFAAPVAFDRDRTPGTGFRGVVVNSGNANACTGAQGESDTAAMASLTAEAIGSLESSILVLSTGIIGEFLPMETITEGIRSAANQLSADEESVMRAARGFMTTDTRPKLAGESFGKTPSGEKYQMLGFAKGAAMIGPKLATMLGLIVTDAAITPEDAQRLIFQACDLSFNCVSVDGHMSTNDTVLLLANGAAGEEPLTGKNLETFETALMNTCDTLAREIADDGEGATHVISIEITGAENREDARRVARAIADSPLVKTAIAGADPNWGRIVSAAGYAGVAFDPGRLNLWVNDFELFKNASPVGFHAEKVSKSIQENRESRIKICLGDGPGTIRFYTSDLTAEYVRLNADYHT